MTHCQRYRKIALAGYEPEHLESLTGSTACRERGVITATIPFALSNQSAHTAGKGCRLLSYEALYVRHPSVSAPPLSG